MPVPDASIDAPTPLAAPVAAATATGRRLTVPGPDDTWLNLKQVAQRLDVHYMTVYRWVRAGRLDARREGTAWRVRETALDEVRPAPPGTARAPRVAADWPARLHDALVVGDEAQAWTVVEGALIAGWDAEAVLVDLLAPAVSSTTPEEGLAAGHLAATTAQRVAAVLSARFRRPGRSRGTVVLGAPPGEGHSLGLALLTDLLRARNVQVRELGGNAPAGAFVDAARSADRLLCVGLGVTDPDRVERARDVIVAVRAEVPGVPVILGGRAVANAELAAVAGADAWAADARDVADLVDRFATTRRRRAPAAADV